MAWRGGAPREAPIVCIPRLAAIPSPGLADLRHARLPSPLPPPCSGRAGAFRRASVAKPFYTIRHCGTIRPGCLTRPSTPGGSRYASAERVGLGAAEHLRLDRLQAVGPPSAGPLLQGSATAARTDWRSALSSSAKGRNGVGTGCARPRRLRPCARPPRRGCGHAAACGCRPGPGAIRSWRRRPRPGTAARPPPRSGPR